MPIQRARPKFSDVKGSIAASLPAGSIIQTQKTVITTPFTIALGQNTDTTVTGMTLNITPSFSNSIIFSTTQNYTQLNSLHE